MFPHARKAFLRKTLKKLLSYLWENWSPIETTKWANNSPARMQILLPAHYAQEQNFVVRTFHIFVQRSLVLGKQARRFFESTSAASRIII
jgi:hypothetical protein